MMVPGVNLLSIALSAIMPQAVSWFSYVSRSQNAAGVWFAQYAAPQTVTSCSVQAVPRSRYEQYNLDFQRNYVYWYVNGVQAVAQDLDREIPGDIIEYAGRRYQVQSATDWYSQDNWSGFICVDVGPATGSTTNA